MKESIRLFRDLILVKPLEKERKTPAGLFIPVQVDEDRARFHDVIAVSPKIDYVKPGDRIVTNANTGGQEFTFNGEDLLVMRGKNILAVME